MDSYQVIVIGGGPAGLAAAIAAKKEAARVLLIEREGRLGGILKQCIHDGFGLIRFKEKLSGPEYVEHFIDEFENLGIEKLLLTFVTKITKMEDGYVVKFVNKRGLSEVFTKTIVLACGCRERTSKQVMIHGTRPAGIFSAGTAQYLTNILGQKITKKCVILGSGDVGLIMARRLTLEGAKVIGVYEIKDSPTGLTRNVQQCLEDYNIPLYLSRTVVRIFGEERLSGVEVAKVDKEMKVIPGTEIVIECDALILSVGLIPENELAEAINVEIDNNTKGPKVNAQGLTSMKGIYSCGNALHVNDLVDYVSESGEIAGKNAAGYNYADEENVPIHYSNNIAYLIPQRLDLKSDNSKTTIYFRSRKVEKQIELVLKIDGLRVWHKHYLKINPPEMERLSLDFNSFKLNKNSRIEFSLETHKNG
ncbi:MAG: NAD(P)/FAD-dependent oxidoreductase [Bacilli bacterium]|jgi:thioredoxin reductase